MSGARASYGLCVCVCVCVCELNSLPRVLQLWLQETRGVEVDPTTPMFIRSDVEWMFDKANRYARLPYCDKYQIFTLVDPNAGGLSNYAIASFVMCEGFIVVRRVSE